MRRRAALLGLFWLAAGCGFFFEGETVYEAAYRRGVYHTVQRGDTLWGISKTYGVDVEEIAVLNAIANPDVVEVGMKIFVPYARRTARVSVAGRNLRPPRKRPRWAEPAKKRRPARTRRRTRPRPRRKSVRVRFDWPVRGKIIRRYGSRRGLRSDGIDIAAAPRTTVKAAAAGKVIFSDWGPGEFGRTIIIRHGGGAFHSVYAYNAQNLVKKGDTVRRGTAIARVGRSGGAQMAMLHFEIRYRTKPRNPIFYLP